MKVWNFVFFWFGLVWLPRRGTKTKP